MGNLSNPSFDYSVISKEEAGKLRYFEGQLLTSRKRVVEEVIRHGEILHGAQEVLSKHGSGVFCSWLESVGISKTSGYRAISVFAEFRDCSNLEQIELSAIYELAKNQRAKTQALKLAGKGEFITHKMAEKLIEQASPKTKGKEDRKDSERVTRTEETPPEPPRNGTDKPGDLLPAEPEGEPEPQPVSVERCPNCAGTKWMDDDEGSHCAKCHHPYGEPAGEVDDDRISIQRSKTIKTAEALMRAFDDLELLQRNKSHAEAIDGCKRLLAIARAWK